MKKVFLTLVVMMVLSSGCEQPTDEPDTPLPHPLP
jgi:hypothetical protein